MATSSSRLRDCILDADDESWLLRHGLLAITRSNKIRIDRRIMYCDDDSTDLPVFDGNEGTVTTPSSSASGQDELPRFLSNNAEVLVYLGFSESRAKQVAAHATRLRREYPEMNDTWINIAFDDAVDSTIADVGPEQENWWPLFQRLGLSEQLYEVIMDPEYGQIRRTETAKYWIRDTMQIRYDHLLKIHEFSRKRGFHVRGSSGGSSTKSEGTHQQARRRRVEPAPVNPATPEVALVDPEEQVPEGYIALWKGLARNRIQYDDQGRVDLQSLISSPPTDFAGTAFDGPVLYFAEDRAVRVKYALYAKNRLNQTGATAEDKAVVLLRLLVKKSWTEGIRRFIDGSDWKKVIWLSRRGKSLRSPQAQRLGIDHYADSQILIGRIAQGVERGYETIESWSSITSLHVVTVPQEEHRKAIHWCFKGRAIEELGENSSIAIDARFEQSQR
ncbi:hypothetical protein F4678DRAFT_484682 [Xylaria arbuscula]|nr:hypothetical protein F4678DRAFT_484682 [Xylaria arbuscula]